MKFSEGNGGWWVEVKYNLVGSDATAAKCFDDEFDMRLAGLFERLPIEDRVEAMMTASNELVLRMPAFELCKPDSAREFLRATKGFGVLWFKRKAKL